MPIIICAIDVGTHSTRSLTCEIRDNGAWNPIDRALKITALGKGLSVEGRILPEDAARSAEAIRGFARRARDLGAEHIRANGTMALRSASNAREVIAAMEERAGVPVTIISGEEEADFTYNGAAKALGLEDSPITVIDVGGGSTEIVWGSGGGRPKFVSSETGCLTFTERFLSSDPPSPHEIERMEESIFRTLDAALPHRDEIPPALAGAGGTITTAAAIELSMEEYDGKRVHGTTLSLRQVEKIYKRLADMRLSDREKVPGLMTERAPVIVAGLAIVKGVMKHLGSETITVSDYGILLGVIMKTFDEIQ